MKENSHDNPELKFIVEGKQFSWPQQYINGAELRQVANLAEATELFLSVQPPWKDERIDVDSKVNLARPEIEHFFVPRKLEYVINGEKFTSESQYITGRKIRLQGNIPADQELFLSIQGPWQDELILDETHVNLARPGIEKFYSKKKEHDFTIIVNGREKPWSHDCIAYEQVVELAYPQSSDSSTKVHTVTYKRGPHQNPEGTMVKGEKVFVKSKMIFNVTCTDKS